MGERCERCGKPTLHGRHLRGEECGGLLALFTRPQYFLRETATHLHTRPEGIEPGKLEIVWPR